MQENVSFSISEPRGGSGIVTHASEAIAERSLGRSSHTLTTTSYVEAALETTVLQVRPLRGRYRIAITSDGFIRGLSVRSPFRADASCADRLVAIEPYDSGYRLSVKGYGAQSCFTNKKMPPLGRDGIRYLSVSYLLSYLTITFFTTGAPSTTAFTM